MPVFRYTTLDSQEVASSGLLIAESALDGRERRVAWPTLAWPCSKLGRQRSVCGNSVVELGEECDPPDAGAGCGAACFFTIGDCCTFHPTPGCSHLEVSYAYGEVHV